MKYKNIEMVAREDSAAEFLVHIWIPEDLADDDDFEEFVDCEFIINLHSHLVRRGWDVEVEHEYNRLVAVRYNGGISFDQKGVTFLIDEFYKEVRSFTASQSDVLEVKVGVHVDNGGEDDVFYDADGNWFNEDSVTPEEFLAHIEY